MSAEERYRGQRRAPEPAVVSRRPRVAVVGALLLVLLAALAMRAMAAGEPRQTGNETIRTPSPAAHPPVPGRTTATVAASSPGTAGKSNEPVEAVPPGASRVPPPEPPTTTYEAEAGANTFGPGVEVRPLAVASGGSVVINIGDRRTLRFNGVTAQAGGGCTLVVFYATNSDRSGWLRIGDGDLQTVSYPSTNGFGRIGSVTVHVELLVGVNTIEFGGSPAALDRITVREDAGNLG